MAMDTIEIETLLNAGEFSISKLNQINGISLPIILATTWDITVK